MDQMDSNTYNADTYNYTTDLPTVMVELDTSLLSAPSHETKGAAGVDVRAAVQGTKTIMPNEKVMLNTGMRMAIPEGFFGMIVPRSGLATKHGLVLSNTVGIIDSDYRGEIMISMQNQSDTAHTIQTGDRVAQMILIPYLPFVVIEGSLTETERNTGGFGSTGVK